MSSDCFLSLTNAVRLSLGDVLSPTAYCFQIGVWSPLRQDPSSLDFCVSEYYVTSILTGLELIQLYTLF